MKFAMAVVALAGLAAAAPTTKPKNASPYHDLTQLAYANARPLTLQAKEKIQHKASQESSVHARATQVRTPTKDNRKLKYSRNIPMAVAQ